MYDFSSLRDSFKNKTQGILEVCFEFCQKHDSWNLRNFFQILSKTWRLESPRLFHILSKKTPEICSKLSEKHDFWSLRDFYNSLKLWFLKFLRFFQISSKRKHRDCFEICQKHEETLEILSNYFKNKTKVVSGILLNHFKNKTKVV